MAKTPSIRTTGLVEPNFQHITKSGKPLATLENTRLVLDDLGATCRYNVIAKKLEIIIPNEIYTQDNADNCAIATIKSEISKHQMPTNHCIEYLMQIGDKNPFNPAATWIDSHPWDGESRLDEFYDTIQSEDIELKKIILNRWMISAVAAVYEPNGISASGVLVLQGAENLGKTKWFKKLADDDAIIKYRQDGMRLDPSNRDSVMNCVRNWLVELGELDATFRRADLSALKAFITADRDVLRLAYATRESEFPRRTIFFGSVNPRQYLHDTNGNRRFWTIECESVNHNHTINMQQVWAEYKVLYDNGEPWHLKQDEYLLIFEKNKDYESTDYLKERLLDCYEWEERELLDREWRWLSSSQILTEIGIDRPSKGDPTRIGQVVGELNGNQRKKSGGKRLLAIPQLKGE